MTCFYPSKCSDYLSLEIEFNRSYQIDIAMSRYKRTCIHFPQEQGFAFMLSLFYIQEHRYKKDEEEQKPPGIPEQKHR